LASIRQLHVITASAELEAPFRSEFERGDHPLQPIIGSKKLSRLEPYDEPYLELFARQPRPGWTAWGDQARMFERQP
jgi:hypothetical protein